MDTDSASLKLPWETPTTVALTDTESRADEADVRQRNGTDTAIPVAVSPNF